MGQCDSWCAEPPSAPFAISAITAADLQELNSIILPEQKPGPAAISITDHGSDMVISSPRLNASDVINDCARPITINVPLLVQLGLDGDGL